jgi:hypothetical protein
MLGPVQCCHCIEDPTKSCLGFRKGFRSLLNAPMVNAQLRRITRSVVKFERINETQTCHSVRSLIDNSKIILSDT